jgi:hypothetical protein
MGVAGAFRLGLVCFIGAASGWFPLLFFPSDVKIYFLCVCESGMSTVSVKRIRDSAVREMSLIFWFHMRLTAIIVIAQAAIPSSVIVVGALPVHLAILFNLFCLAERFWDVQLRSLVYWPPLCQFMFVVSRLMLITIAVLVCVLLVRVGFRA